MGKTFIGLTFSVLVFLAGACAPVFKVSKPVPSPRPTSGSSSASQQLADWKQVPLRRAEPEFRAQLAEPELAIRESQQRTVMQDVPRLSLFASDTGSQEGALRMPNRVLTAGTVEPQSGSSSGRAEERWVIEALDRLALQVPVREDARGKYVRFPSDELFEPGEPNLSSQSIAQQMKLDEVAKVIKAITNRRILVQAFTDSLGPTDETASLSLERARAVRDYLVLRGVPAEALCAQGMGSRYPIASNREPLGRSENRRIEIVIAKPARDRCDR